jgi:polynucleotide 5'-kinase involved in rRNA processing
MQGWIQIGRRSAKSRAGGDRLGAYADALALLMDSKAADTPLTIAINGPWGSGKTSLAEMAEFRLKFGTTGDQPM